MLGVGVVGYGYWGPRLSRVVAQSDFCHLAAICEQGSGLSAARRAHEDTWCTAEYVDLLNSDEIDAIALATPAETHHSLALLALEAGKHVFVEKPLALELDHVKRLSELANELDLTLMVDHVYVFSGPVDRIADLMASETIAPTRYHSARVNMGRVAGAIDVLFDLVVHDVAILDRLKGAQPVEVRAEPANEAAYGPGELVRVVLTYDDGFEADINAGWSAPTKHRLIELTGDGHVLAYDDDEPIDKLRLRTVDGERVVDCDLTEPLARSVAHFVACIGGDVVPMADGAAAQRVVTVLEAMARSLAKVPA